MLNTGGNHSFLQEQVHTNAAAVVPDSVRNPQLDYQPREITDKIKTIAHLSKPLPNRYLEDYVAFREYLRTTMTRDLFRFLNKELLTGDSTSTRLLGVLGTSGLQQQAWKSNLPTMLRKAREKLTNRDEQPTAWLVSAEAIDLFADAQSRFQSLKGHPGEPAGGPDRRAHRGAGCPGRLAVGKDGHVPG